jgi:hypothetical protein
MKTAENTISSPFNDWFAFQKSLNWKDDRTQDENARKTFLEAMRQGISRSKAYFEVANRIDQIGRPVDWRKLHVLWCRAWGEWDAQRNGQVAKPAAPISPVPDSHDTQQVVLAPAP